MRTNLLHAIKAKGLTISAAARLIGITRQSLHVLITGKTKGRIETWIKLNNLLDHDIETLYKDEKK